MDSTTVRSARPLIGRRHAEHVPPCRRSIGPSLACSTRECIDDPRFWAPLRVGCRYSNVRHHIYYNADKPGGVRLDLLDNTGDRFDYFRFDKSSGLLASEAPLRLVWRVRTVGALARHSRAQDPLSAFIPVCARVVALSLCSSMKFERSVSSFTVLAYAQDI